MNIPFLHSDDMEHPVILKKKQLTLGQRAADAMTIGMGSWPFLIFFSLIIVVWLSLNIYGFFHHWDPYPFILLNLALSMISAFQAPIIMMSQNRAAERDRLAAKYDYAVNRKAEREVLQVLDEIAELKALVQKLSKKK
jgi:uncharacterized membrane protein